jgi:hypothetical protein
MRVGLAIPCYKDHIPQLWELLQDVAAQTRLPDLVVVSCSSTPEVIQPPMDYPFPLLFMTTPEFKNAAQNRNRAIDVLLQQGCDAVSFIDADDRMHPQRFEAVEVALQDSDFVLHSFILPEDAAPFTPWLGGEIERGVLERAPSGCVYGGETRDIHHSQVTVRSSVLHQVRFPEEQEVFGREDALFCGAAILLPGIRTAYIQHRLSRYSPSRSWM